MAARDLAEDVPQLFRDHGTEDSRVEMPELLAESERQQPRALSWHAVIRNHGQQECKRVLCQKPVCLGVGGRLPALSERQTREFVVQPCEQRGGIPALIVASHETHRRV